MEVEDKNNSATKKEIKNSQFINFKDSVKSKYIQILTFSFLDRNYILDLVKYNLKLQELLEININTYKEISQSIKIGKGDGYCRIYDLYTMALKFEGEYKNGKKNGKGKEFYKSHDIYENEYSLGEKSGSKLIYEGEFSNGKRNGKGKEYDDNGKLIFEGEYKNGKKFKGIINIYYYSSLLYNGEFSNGKKNGIGKEYFDNGKLKFEGEFLNGKKWNGIIYNQYNNDYKFEIKNGNGKIKEYDQERNLLFEGEYINGDKKGKEYMYIKYGDKELIFDGYYLNDEKWNGKLKDYKKGYHWRCGYGRHRDRYDDNESEIKIENGKKYENDILKFEGEYLNGKRNGKGKEYDINGKLTYEGDFLMGKQGYSYKKDYDYLTLEYEGEILEGKRHGKGKEYYFGGRIIFEGEYLNGERWNGKMKEYEHEIETEKEYVNGKIVKNDEYGSREKLKNKDINSLKEKEEVKVIKEFFEESDKIRFEGEYLNNEKWNGIMHNKDDNINIEIKNGNWSLNDSALKFKYLGEDKYIIQDKNGKTKEYYNGLLSYEGEYLNDKRNGKGKEYDYKRKILFEGEYINGERWNGKIKELIKYNSNEMEFEGEYINGEKIGKVKKYYTNYSGRNLEYEGGFKNDKKNGYGKEYYEEYQEEEKLIYEGEFLDDKRNGKGKEYYKGQLRFEGEYLNGKRWNGKYRLINSWGQPEFEGELINGEKKGKEYLLGNLIYEGEYLNLKKNGKGKEYYKNGKIKFEGEYILDNKWTGNMYDPDGNFTFKMIDGEGNGKEYDNDGKLRYDGEYLNGIKNGKGREFKYNKLIFEGEYLNGERNGKGKEYYDLKTIIEFKNRKKNYY